MKLKIFSMILLAVAFLHAVASSQIQEWQVESYDARGLLINWTNVSGDQFNLQPTLTTALAVPAGSTVTASFKAIVSHSKNINSWGNLIVSSSARYRDLMIVAVTWNLPKGKDKWLLPLSAQIEFQFNSANQNSSRPAFVAAADNAAEIALQSWIINYAQSRSLRSTPMLLLGKTTGVGPSGSAFLAKQRLVIKTENENIASLSFEDLKKASVPLEKIDPRVMRLYRNGVEVPMYIQGEDDGVWNAGDYLEFMGGRAEGINSFNSFYTSSATFILTWDGGRKALRVPRVPAASHSGGAVPAEVAAKNRAKPFLSHTHFELDNEVLRIGSTSAEEIVDLGANVQESELTDFWFWKRLGTQVDNTEIPFNLNFSPAIQAAGIGGNLISDASLNASNLRVTLNFKGITNNPKANPDHHLKFILNGTDISLVGGESHDAIWEGQESYTWTSPALNPSILKAGKNTLIIQKVNDLKTTDGQLVENQDAFLNYVELDFPANYQVQSDNLHFSNHFSDSIGTKVFTLTGFSNPNISLWDKQGRKLDNYYVKQQNGSYQVQFLDSLVGLTEYVATTHARRETPFVRLDTLPDLLNPSQGADYIVITQKSLLSPALDSLLDFRRKQGLRTAVVFADDIYQAFGDGSMDPLAIKKFVANAYKNWPRPAPTYLCLIGDASLWFEKKAGSIQFTTVPTNLVNIRGWGVAANDDYFVKVSGDDDIADLFVGRIPVTTTKDLSAIVHKTLLQETSRPEGHWRNKSLLISGYESSFMNQNYVLQAIAVKNNRQISRLDLFPGSPHYKTSSQRGNFYDQLDSGFSLVNFIGHGGGAVWSDAGVLTLKALDENRLKGPYAIPLVSSITCLTGYFEDVAARSLGEEMIRLPTGGAAGFYGAAGFISNLAGEALSTEIVKATTSNKYGTIGAITSQAETMVKLQTGTAYSPVLAEFNLLGDPALHLSFPADEGSLSLKPQTLAGKGDLEISTTNLPPDYTDGIATIFLGDSTERSVSLKINSGKFSMSHSLSMPVEAIQNGKVVFHYWNEKQSRIMAAPFSTLDWLIDSISFSPANAAPGDSVKIKYVLNTAYPKVNFSNGIVSHVVGGIDAPLFPGNNQSILKSDDQVHFESANLIEIDVPQANISNPHLFVAFRLNVQLLDEQNQIISSIPNLSSRTYKLPLTNLASLHLPPSAFHLPIQEQLGVWVTFHNKGLGTASGFKISLLQDGESSFPIRDTLTYSKKLAFGEKDSLFFALPDSMLLGKRLRASLIPSRPGELATFGLSQDTVFKIQTQSIISSTDSLLLDTLGTTLVLQNSNSTPHRFFARNINVTSLPSHLARPDGILPFAALLVEGDSTITSSFFIKQKELAPLGSKLPASWHYRYLQGSTWIKLDTIITNSIVMTKGFKSGLYALLINQDGSAPIIQVSSHGQVLLPDDYVPLHTPIDISIRDGQGIDLLIHPPKLWSREQSLDSVNFASESNSLFPTLARMNFLPQIKSNRDSLDITATDVSGNVSRRSLIYRLGDDLSIRNLGSYPNPFADTATFVFSVTDFCDQIVFKIYSRAGRLVRTLSQQNVVGYQEVMWDGRTDDNSEIANGLYFLKVTACARGKEASEIFKLFKKQRK